ALTAISWGREVCMTSRVRALFPLVLAVLLAPGVHAVPQGGVDKSLFVAVLDDNGRPVREFTADDVLIREDGQDRTVVAVKPASQPISVAVVVDTAQGRRVTYADGSPEADVPQLRATI